jgi:DNA-binding CsgD family transcriptional regulator/PAS domain-containing protein
MAIRNDDHWVALVDSFHAAALGGQSWDTALQGLADATGSRSAQLVGVDSGASVVFNIITNVDPGVPQFIAATTDINPRVRVANTAPLLKPVADWDFMTPEECRRNHFYQEFCYPWDVPFVCLATLERQPGRFIALAVIRSAQEGHIEAGERHLFARLAPHVRAAVRTQVALAGRGISLLTGALETLTIPVFVCDSTGKVKRLTAAAEALIGRQRGLQIKDGRLRALQAGEARALDEAILSVGATPTSPAPPAARTVVIRSAEPDAAPLLLDVFPLPWAQHPLDFTDFTARVLIVARGTRESAAPGTAVLMSTYGFTAAEVEVALLLCKGNTAEAIAKTRRVAVGTVRSQIKAILSKAGLKRQAELAARLSALQ